MAAPISERARRERAHFDDLADELGNVWWGHKTRAGQARLDDRRRLAERAQVGPGTLVLEPGAGSGEFSSRLAATGARVVAVELSIKQARIGRANLGGMKNLRFLAADVARLPFPDRAFDVVAGCSVLHHLDMQAALPEFHRVLKPGGRFLFSEPNMLNPQIAVEKNVPIVGRRLGNSPDETAFFRWAVARLLRRHGFTDVRVRPFDFLHPGTPDRWIPLVHRMSEVLERIPLVREFAGSLWIAAVRQ